MQIQQFIADFEQQFEEVAPGTIGAATALESLDEWSSLQALVIIAMIDSKYGVRVGGAEINSAATVQDIFDIVSRNGGQ